METTTRMFRKAAFGGFNKEDVVDYIEKMKREFADYKQQVEETIQSLNDQLAALETTDETDANAAFVRREPVNTSAASNIDEATNHLKQVADELCDNLNRLIEKLHPQTDDSAVAPVAAVENEESEEKDPVAAIMEGLFASLPTATELPQPPAQTDADLIAAVLPKYLN